MTQHSQNGEGVEVIQSDRDQAAKLIRTGRLSLKEMVAADMGEGRADDSDVVQAFARYRQSLTAREPATADVGRLNEAYKAVEAWPENRGDPITVGSDGFMDLLKLRNIVGEMLPALSRAAPSSGHAMAEGEREINCAVCGESVKHTSAGYCFSCIKGFKVPLTTTPPTTNDAIPAGMVRWDGAPDDWHWPLAVMLRNGTIVHGMPAHDLRWRHATGNGKREDIIAYTPKASAAPSASATEAGGVERDRTAKRIAELIAEGDGSWSPCSGCQEGVDGYVSEKDYPYDPTFQCQPGGGCGECGGIGVIWYDRESFKSWEDFAEGDATSTDQVKDGKDSRP